MGRLLKNELIKVRYSTVTWCTLGIVVVLVFMVGGVDMSNGNFILADYGYTVSLAYMCECGTLISMFLSPIAAALLAQEFEQGTMHNTLSCGVSRTQYFIVKTVVMIIISVVIFSVSVVEYVCIVSIVQGFFPASYKYPHWLLVNLVYHAGNCFLVVIYTMFFILVTMIVRKQAIAYLLGMITWFGEAVLSDQFSSYKGPFAIMFPMYDMAIARKVLTLEFVELFGQCAIIFLVILALSYLVFLKRDIN